MSFSREKAGWGCAAGDRHGELSRSQIPAGLQLRVRDMEPNLAARTVVADQDRAVLDTRIIELAAARPRRADAQHGAENLFLPGRDHRGRPPILCSGGRRE